MAAMAVGPRPTLYLPGRGMLVSYAESLSVLRVAELLKGAGDLRSLARPVLERALAKATQLGVSICPGPVFVEEDPEVRGWRYAVVPLQVSAPGEARAAVVESLVREAYRGLKAEEALRVHVEVECV